MRDSETTREQKRSFSESTAMKDPYIDDVIRKGLDGELGDLVPRPRHTPTVRTFLH